MIGPELERVSSKPSTKFKEFQSANGALNALTNLNLWKRVLHRLQKV